MHQILRLNGLNSCALIQFEKGHMPTWRHFGAKVGSTPVAEKWPDIALRNLPPGSMDSLVGKPLVACFGNAQAQTPSLRTHRDGMGGIQDLVAVDFAFRTTNSTHQLVLQLQDSTTEAGMGLALRLTLTMHSDCDVLSFQTTLTNTGRGTLQVDGMAAGTVAVDASMQDIASYSGQWAHEFAWQRMRLPAHGWHVDNTRGRTSHETPPAFFLMQPSADDHRGEVIAAHLAWSGNHSQAVQRHADGSLALQAGEWLAPGEVRLQTGDSLESPQLLVSWSDNGINGVSANLHQFARKYVLKFGDMGMRPRPVHLNTWEAVYFDHDQQVLRELATQAAALGVERFVLDDGWFPGRPNDMSGLGDWWPDPAKYPQGLNPLIGHVRRLGMEFGLWVEPEMVNPDSDLYRQHPDWVLQSAGRALQFGRHQLVLDISSNEVSGYLFDKLHRLLTDHPIAYLKWDMNRNLAHAEDANGQIAYHKQVHALYALLARLRHAHPQVEIESCASGGGRMDLGILQHTQRFWTSDNNDALSRVSIQSGAARLFPLEVLGAHVGPAPAHSTGRSQSMDFRCAVAFFGHMGVEADVRHLPATEKAALKSWVALYKVWRGVLHAGQFSQGQTANGVWWLVQTPNACVLGVFTTQAPATDHHAPLRLHGFIGDGDWKVTLLGRAGHERARNQTNSPWLQQLQNNGLTYSASELRHVGLNLPNMNPESALVIALQHL